MLAVVSALSASAATVLFDFNSSLLPETPAKTVSVTDSGSGFVATLATASSSANLGSTSSAASGDWVSSGTSFDTQGLDSFMENQISFGNSWQTFISGSKGASLSLTISGLVAGASYQIALVTGCPFEGAGAWNSLVTSNTYDSAAPSIGANSQTIQARTPTGYTISDVIANYSDGEYSWFLPHAYVQCSGYFWRNSQRSGTGHGVPESAGADGPDGSPPKSLRTSFPAVKNVVACKV